MKIKELLLHADFVRSLARCLVLDDDRAFDLEQETLLAALKKPPSNKTPLRPWLARVTRNLAVSMFRKESRRSKREKAFIDHKSFPQPDEIVARGEIGRNLIQTVLNLREPYRSIILLRFYENMTIQQMSENLDVPLGTIKTRVKRGLEMLRAVLDADYHGKREKWMLTLAPIAGLKISSSFPLVTGVLALSIKTKIGMIAAVLLGVFISFWSLVSNGQPLDTLEISESSQPVITQTDNKNESSNPVLFQPNNFKPAFETINPTGYFISGKVTDMVTGKPIQVYSLDIYPHNMLEYDENRVIQETVKNKDGRYYFPLETHGEYLIHIHSSCYIEQSILNINIPENEDLKDVNIELDPGFSLSGYVKDDITDVPIKGVLIGTDDNTRISDTNEFRIYAGEEECSVHAWTDEKGYFLFKGLKNVPQHIVASHPDYAQAFVKVQPEEADEIELRLETGYHIFGKVLDNQGEPLPEASITVFTHDSMVKTRRVNTGPDGSYKTAPVLPGNINISAFYRPNNPLFTEDQRDVLVKDKNLKVDFGPLDKDFVTWRGVLYDLEDKPRSHGLLTISQDLNYNWSIRHRDRTVRCDKHGNFEAIKLRPGAYRVKSETQPIMWNDVFIDKPGLFKKDIRPFGATICGKVIDGFTGNPMTGQKGTVTAILSTKGWKHYETSINEKGAFSFVGLSPGIYTLKAEANKKRSYEVEGVFMETNQKLDNLKIVIPRGGFLNLAMINLDLPGLERGTVYFNHSSGARPEIVYSFHAKADGTEHRTHYFEIGKWETNIFFNGKGFAKNVFHILPDKDTFLEIDGKKLSFYKGNVTCKGKVTRADNTPLDGIPLQFYRRMGGGSPFSVRTDKDGCYYADNLKPGEWVISTNLRGCGAFSFTRFWIPNNPSSPMTLDLKMPAGMVKGVFIDRKSGQSFEKTPVEWEASLRDPKIVYACHGSQRENSDWHNKGSKFNMGGVKQGRYVFVLEVAGYFEYRTQPFDFSDGQQLDLGTIPLNKCGILDLHVKDKNGDPIRFFSLYCNGEEHVYWRNSSQKVRWDKLPLGELNLRFNAMGYKDNEIKVCLEPGIPKKVEVVLDSY